MTKLRVLVLSFPYFTDISNASSYLSLPLSYGWTRYLPSPSFGAYCHSYQLVLGTMKVLCTFSKIWPITIKCLQTLDTPKKNGYNPCIWPTSVDDSINRLWGHIQSLFSLLVFFLVGLFAMSHCELDHQFFIKFFETLDIPLRGSFHSQNSIEVLHLYTL
jgi:hypothetical protein